MTLEIREVDHSDEEALRAVGALRYEVNVTEMQLSMRHADHERQIIIEPLDFTGHVFAAYVHGELVGTMRQNLLREADVGEYAETYGIANLPSESLDSVSITTRLVIKQQFRRTRAALELPIHGYKFLLDNYITFDVIDSRPNLLPFFRKLGYRTHVPCWRHPEFGEVVVQYLAVEDRAHLCSVRSPFVRILDRHLATL